MNDSTLPPEPGERNPLDRARRAPADRPTSEQTPEPDASTQSIHLPQTTESGNHSDDPTSAWYQSWSIPLGGHHAVGLSSVPTAPTPAMAGKDFFDFHLAGYEILEKFRGGMGEVYKAKRIELDALVALKILPREYAEDPDRVERFWNEIRILSRLRDARIVPALDLVWSDFGPVLVMPFIEGTDLARLIQERELVTQVNASEVSSVPSSSSQRSYLDRVLPLLDQLVEAVSAVHEAGILHRDIKPSNCLIDRRGNLYLSDFGLARLGPSLELTSAKVFLGTRGYASPEQWEDASQITKPADVFSLGATIYKALALQLPYGRGRINSDTEPPPEPHRRTRGLWAGYSAVILKALNPVPARRYPDVVQFREDWVRVRAGLMPKQARVKGPARRLAHAFKRHHSSVVYGIACLFLASALFANLGPRRPEAAVDQASVPVEVASDPPGAVSCSCRSTPRPVSCVPRNAFRPSRTGARPAGSRQRRETTWSSSAGPTAVFTRSIATSRARERPGS